MAESASMFLSQNQGMTLCVIAGVGHVIGRAGIPDRIMRRQRQQTPQQVEQEVPFVIVPQQVDWLDNGLPDIDVPLAQADCDWAW